MQVSAIAIGFFLGFVIPIATVYFLGFAIAAAYAGTSAQTIHWYGLFILPIAIVPPVIAGYVSARIARSQPLFHGFVVGVLGSLAILPFFTPWTIGLGWAIAFVPGAIFGAWLWRRRAGGESAL